MKHKILEATGTAAIMILATAIFTQIPAFGQEIGDQEPAEKQMKQNNLNRGNGAGALEGSWTVQVTIRNCQTGAAIRTFPRLETFIQGGTMQETAAAGTAAAPALRSPGHGVWEHFSEQNYYYALQFLRLTADGGRAGSVRERRYVNVHILGNSFEAAGTGEVFDAAGNLLVATCATETGARFR